MEQQQPHDLEVPSPPPAADAPRAVDSRPVADLPPAKAVQPDELNGDGKSGLGALGTTLLVLGNVLYFLTAVPAYAIYVLATQLTDESQLDLSTFWMSIGWIISFVAGWAAFYWLHRQGAARKGAAVFCGIFAFWLGTSLLPLVIAWYP